MGVSLADKSNRKSSTCTYVGLSSHCLEMGVTHSSSVHKNVLVLLHIRTIQYFGTPLLTKKKIELKDVQWCHILFYVLQCLLRAVLQ